MVSKILKKILIIYRHDIYICVRSSSTFNSMDSVVEVEQDNTVVVVVVVANIEVLAQQTHS